MRINILKNFLFCILFISEIYQLEEVKLKQSIFDQAEYYDTNEVEIYGSFIDFGNYKFYKLNMSKIHHISDTTPKFEFFLDGEELSIRCKKNKEEKVKCNEIIFGEHSYISFDFDLNIANTGGLISFILIFIGIFCLRTGYIYYNIPVAFYSGFSVLLFFRAPDGVGRFKAAEPQSKVSGSKFKVFAHRFTRIFFSSSSELPSLRRRGRGGSHLKRA